MAFKISPITDVNAITCHYLQCINNKIKMEAESKKVTYINLFNSFLVYIGTLI